MMERDDQSLQLIDDDPIIRTVLGAFVIVKYLVSGEVIVRYSVFETVLGARVRVMVIMLVDPGSVRVE